MAWFKKCLAAAAILAAAAMVWGWAGARAAPGDGAWKSQADQAASQQPQVKEDGTYTSKKEVAQYVHLYGKLPGNYLTKEEARRLGWDSKKGNLGQVAPGKSIGGDRFSNYEGLLPEKKGRTWRECDIGYEGGYRGPKRLAYSDDGLVYYTGDHYKSFEKLY